MNKFILIIATYFVTSCSTFKGSAYHSGWDNKESERKYSQCAVVWLKKDMLVPDNLERLVQNGYLNIDEAERAKTTDLRIGDTECAAFAAFGLQRSKISIHKNKDGQLIRKTYVYRCENSQASCPGVEIDVIDGRVSGIKPLKE